MKYIVALLVFCSIGFISFGQQKVEPGISTVDTAFFNNIKHFQVLSANEILVNKIRILPLDKMPCLVANEKLITPIPNAVVKSEQVNNMPNAFKKKN
jgi:hypothetical protein